VWYLQPSASHHLVVLDFSISIYSSSSSQPRSSLVTRTPHRASTSTPHTLPCFSHIYTTPFINNTKGITYNLDPKQNPFKASEHRSLGGEK
jgi:hypothetical protein